MNHTVKSPVTSELQKEATHYYACLRLRTEISQTLFSPTFKRETGRQKKLAKQVNELGLLLNKYKYE
jgi:hypothetical protein